MICPGTNVIFTATPQNGGATPGYQWKKNNINIGNNSNAYSDNALTGNDIISCNMTGNQLCTAPTSATSNSISFVLNSTIVPEVTISSDRGNNICQGDTVVFSATPVSGGSSPVYQWKKNGINVGANSNTLFISGLNTSDSINCEMTSNVNCVVVNPAVSNKIGMIANACGLALDLKVYIQGFYRGGGVMCPVADPSGQSGICDTVSVALVNSSFPFDDLYHNQGVIDMYGAGVFYFPNAILNTDYFIVVRHRNALEAWSNLPQTATASILYDFTVSDTTAYGGNMADLGDGNFGLYSGDVSSSIPGQRDGIIDDNDLDEIVNASFNFQIGYTLSDLTGDLMTESTDYSVIENNRNMLIMVSRP